MHELNGVIPLDKPAGITSAQALNQVKRLLPRGTKLGHAGTLDRFATGLLLLLVGRATRLCESLMDKTKTYEATIRLGATTATDDPESPEQPFHGAARPSRAEVEKVLERSVGELLQSPPVYSAVKMSGKRASDRARAGESVAPEPRLVRIDSIELLSHQFPDLCVRVVCGRGTYIRALARDVGTALGCGGHLRALRRTRCGEFDVSDAPSLEVLSRGGIERFVVQAGRGGTPGAASV